MISWFIDDLSIESNCYDDHEMKRNGNLPWDDVVQVSASNLVSLVVVVVKPTRVANVRWGVRKWIVVRTNFWRKQVGWPWDWKIWEEEGTPRLGSKERGVLTDPNYLPRIFPSPVEAKISARMKTSRVEWNF